MKIIGKMVWLDWILLGLIVICFAYFICCYRKYKERVKVPTLDEVLEVEEDLTEKEKKSGN